MFCITHSGISIVFMQFVSLLMIAEIVSNGMLSLPNAMAVVGKHVSRASRWRVLMKSRHRSGYDHYHILGSVRAVCTVIRSTATQRRNSPATIERKKKTREKERVPLPDRMDSPLQAERLWGKGQRAKRKSNASSAAERSQTRSVPAQR